MKNKLTSFILVLCLLIAIPLSARYKYNPFTRKLDYYEPVSGSDLGDLGDVTLTGLATGNVLYYDGSAWVNLVTGANTEFLTLAAGIPAWVAIGIPDPANVFYVSATGGDYTTIQAALNAENSGGETFLVGPGTYTDTISFTANDQVVKPLGHAANVIVTQADANIVDAGAFTDCIIEDIEFRLTAPTTAINAIQVGTGTLILIECRGYLATAVALAQVDQPSIVGFTDAGTIRIKRGNYQYYHTGNTGGTGVKAAFRANVNLAELHLHKIDVAVVTNSGTALVTSFFLTTGTAVVEMHNVVDCVVTDPDATNVIGMGYLAGGGIHNLQGNHIDVVATNNTSYGLYHGGTSTIRSAFNAIHASDVAGSSYAFYVGGSATLNSHFDDLRSDDGNSIAGTFVQVSSPADGDLVITDELEVINTLAYDYTTEHVLLFGYLAGEDLVAGGQYNTLIGEQAGTDITTGDNNVIIGFQAGFVPTITGDMVLVGKEAGYQTTTVGLVAVGFEAGRVSTGVGNTFVGYQSGETNTSGARNTFIGFDTGQGKVTANDNVGVGYQALYGTGPTGNFNTAVGVTALFQSTGQNNTAVGGKAGYSNIAGTDNVYVGYDAGYFNESGLGNTGVGRSALQGTTGENFSSNVGIGQNVGVALTTGSNNTIVGYQAGTALTSGGSNVLLGYLAGSQLTNETDKLYIENSNSATPLIYGDFSTDNITINGAFNITMDAAAEVMNIIQSNAAGPSNVPLIFIDDARTGGTANVKEEATLRIDAEGLYSFYFEDGWQYFGDRSVWGPDVPLYIGEDTDQFVAMWDSNGAADGLMLMGGGDATNDSSALMFIKAGLTVDGMTDHDDYKSTTFVVVNRQGADGDDYSAVVMGERAQGDVTAAHYFDFYAMTGALDGVVDPANTELGAIFRFGDNPTATNHSLGAGDVLINDDFEVDGASYFDGIVDTYQHYSISATKMLHAPGTANVFLGQSTGVALTTATNTTAIGFEAANSLTSGNFNVMIGHIAGKDGTTCYENVLVGAGAAEDITTAFYSTIVGPWAAHSLTSGIGNTVVGRAAASFNQTGTYNTVVGYEAGKGVSANSYSYNVLLGYQAGFNLSAGADWNVMIGERAGNNNQFGDGNVFIGRTAGYNEMGSNKLYIDNESVTTPLIYGEFDNDLVTINGLFGYGTAVELTIDGAGDVAATRSYHAIIVNGGTGSGADDLDTIAGGAQGQIITIYPKTSGVADTVTVKDAGGNIACAGDFAMDHVNDRMMLVYDGSNWCEISRSDND